MIHRNLFSNVQCVSIVMTALCESQAYLSVEPAGSQHCLVHNIAAILACRWEYRALRPFTSIPVSLFTFLSFVSMCLYISVVFLLLSVHFLYFISFISSIFYFFFVSLFYFLLHQMSLVPTSHV